MFPSQYVCIYFVDSLIKNFEETVAANESTIESLTYKLSELQLELTSKEDRLNDMQNLNERKEKENTDLIACNKKLAEHLDKAMQENQSLENFVKVLTSQLADLDRQSVAFCEKVVKANAFVDSCFELLQEEKRLATQKAQQRYDWLHGQLLNTTSEKDALQMVNQELNNKITELQNDQQSTIAQHAEECRIAEEKVLKLESETEVLASKKTEMENLIITLEDKIRSLSEASRLSEMQMVRMYPTITKVLDYHIMLNQYVLLKMQQDFQLKHSESETENKEIIKNLQSEIQKKEEEIDNLQKEVVNHEQNEDSQEKQLNQLQSLLQEKEQVVLELKEKEKQIEDQLTEVLFLYTSIAVIYILS